MLAPDDRGDVDAAPAPAFSVTEDARRRLRAILRENLPALQHLVGLAVAAAEGPDPEVAVIYLSMARERGLLEAAREIVPTPPA
jgi:hypothetical protein